MSWIGAAIESIVVMTGSLVQSSKELFKKIPVAPNPMMIRTNYKYKLLNLTQ